VIISGEEKLRRYPHNEAQYLLGPVETAGKPPFFIDARDPLGSAWTRFINCIGPKDSPNVGFFQGPPIHGDAVFVKALKTIREKEELRADYGHTFTWGDGLPRY